jgi:2-polyprenyl-6-methoxyphenol hydroxylase-like FAD-dependent oxidoreductase
MKVSIIGAGIAGLTTAIALKKEGITAEVFEAAPQLSAVGAGLGLAPNAIMALSHIGLDEKVVSVGRQLPYFQILDQQGGLISSADSKYVVEKYGIDNFTIHRADLHECLLNELDSHFVHTNKRVVHCRPYRTGAELTFSDGSIHQTDYLIVADGINSAVRKKILPDAKTRYAGYTCWRAVVDAKGLDLEGASETWGAHGRFGIVPLQDGQVYWFACINAAADDPTFKNFGTANLIQHFQGYHAPILQLLDLTPDHALIRNDIYDIQPLKKFAYGRILFIGDAAHATTPNMGQGACQAIEDAVILANEFKTSSDLEEAFRKFEKKRLKRTSAIISQSRRIGAMAQWSNPIAILLRNWLLKHSPAGLQKKQFEELYRFKL